MIVFCGICGYKLCRFCYNMHSSAVCEFFCNCLGSLSFDIMVRIVVMNSMPVLVRGRVTKPATHARKVYSCVMLCECNVIISPWRRASECT